MINLEGKLFHPKEAFLRETFEKRMADYGFKNMARIELFLWDLEMFLQIQDILKDKIVLKGGSAVQFYLPISAQRTSVDIDIIFTGTKAEIEKVLSSITVKLRNTEECFEFREHKPKEPKTELPLYTYYSNIPSVITGIELRKEIQKQEIKIEFFINPDYVEIYKTKGKLFAVDSNKEYNILPLNNLFADKLTTLGPNTIGIQDSRIDEQVKQLFDIWMLTKYNFSCFNFEKIRQKYIDRAKLECDIRKIPFNLNEIKADVFMQLRRVSEVDCAEDVVLKKYINDFNSLYLSSVIDFSPASVAIGSEQIKMIYETVVTENGSDFAIKKAYELNSILKLNQFSGIEKGNKTRELRDILIKEFAFCSTVSPKILKGKNLIRVFWSVVTSENIKEIEFLVNDYLGI